MKFDKQKHKHIWRIQKGCNVEWFKDSKKGSGIIKRVISEDSPWGKIPSRVVVVDKDNNEVELDIDKVRILKTSSALKKEEIAKRYN